MKFRRKIWQTVVILLVVILVAASFLVVAQAASVSDFTDVSTSAWYYDAVGFVTSKGLFQGTSPTTFSPNGTMMRGMFIAVLGRYAGVDASAWCAATITGSGVYLRSGPSTSYSVAATLSKNTKVTILSVSGEWYQIQYGSQTGYVYGSYVSPTYHRFSDVAYDSYYAGYAIWAYEKGIVNGMGSADVFAPGNNITREQICALLNRYISYAGLSLSSSGSSVTFADAGSISSWAAADVAAMQSYGIVQGEKINSQWYFRPASNATRAEAATMFQRLYNAASGGTTATPTPSATAAPQPTEQAGAATFLSDRIAVKSQTVRVGIMVSTAGYNSSVSSVTLANTNGAGFEYGTFNSDRSFVSAGSISSSSITVTTNGTTFTVKDSAGTTVYTTTSDLAIHPTASGSTKTLTRVNGNYRYFGDFELRQAYYRSGYITVTNYVNVEDYVKGVIPYEYSASWPTETLKAAAITIRNFVMTADWSTYSSYGFDVLYISQTYYGRNTSYSEGYFSASDAAVDATAGVYLTYKYNGTNRLCSTYYFSSDGGATEDSAHIWGGSYSYLVGKVDPYESSAASQASNYTYSIKNSRTGTTMTQLASGLGLSTLAENGIRIETYSVTGNVKSITLTDIRGKSVTISQSTSYGRWDFLSDFGFTAYSYRFQVDYDASSDCFTCTRYGWGHNVGLSQWGAYAMARYYGKNYQEILGFYYDGTHLQYGAY